MQIYAVYLFEALPHSELFYQDLKNLTLFLEKDFNILKFYQNHISDNKHFEVAIRRLLQSVKFKDSEGANRFILGVKIFKPINLKRFLETLLMVYEQNFQ